MREGKVSMTRHLYMTHSVGYKTDIPFEMTGLELCQQVLASCQQFTYDLMDLGYYSDGPSCFVTRPFSEEKEMTLFTTIGNRVHVKAPNLSEIVFQESLVVKSQDFQRLIASDLETYYETLKSKLDQHQLSKVNVYHILFMKNEDLMVDVYCEVLNDL